MGVPGQPWRFVVAGVLALAQVSLGCASLTPSHPDSGWSSKGKVPKDRKAEERLEVIPLQTTAQMNRARRLLGLYVEPGAELGLDPGSAAAASIAARAVLGVVLSAWRSDIENAAAAHVSRATSRSPVVPSFYEGEVGKLGMDLQGVLVMRQIRIGKCRDDAPPGEWKPANVDPGDPTAIPKNTYRGPWCIASAVLFEVAEWEPGSTALGTAEETDAALGATSGLFRLQPAEHGVKLYRSRAKIVDPSWYAPWTWWTDAANFRWWAPTWGDKAYLDQLDVELELIPLERPLGYLPRPAPQKHLWRFERMPLDKTGAACEVDGTVRDTNPSLPFNYIPIGHRAFERSADTTPAAGGAASYAVTTSAGRGAYQIRVTMTEIDAMGERLGSVSKLLADYGDEGIGFVTEAIEEQADD